MDANGTRFHLLLGRRDWQPVIEQSRATDTAVQRWSAGAGSASDFVPCWWDDAFGGIALVRQVPVLRAPGALDPLTGNERRGAAADGYGDIFWIGADDARIHVQPKGLTAAGEFWHVGLLAEGEAPRAPGPFAPESARTPSVFPSLSGLAITATHTLVVGTREPAGLLLFDLHSAGAPVWWRWPDTAGLQPFSIAASPDGGVVILDRNGASGTARLWRLDRHFRVIPLGAPLEVLPAEPLLFHREGGAPGSRPAATLGGPADLGPAFGLDAADPVGVAALSDGSVLILDAGAPGEPSRIVRYREGQPASAVVLDVPRLQPHLDVAISGAHAFAVTCDPQTEADRSSGWIHIATRTRSQVFRLRFTSGETFTAGIDPVALPLQGYRGLGLVAAGSDVFYDTGGRWIAAAEQPRYRYFPEGVADGPALVFDGKEPGCVWHRASFDACIPGGCTLEVWSRAADEQDRLESARWQQEPAPYQRGDGSEVPFDRPFGTGRTSGSSTGTYETLFQEVAGRFLQLRLVLRGDGRTSPRIRALRVYYPRFSYLHRYLPAVYREDAAAANFLDRWLSNAEGLLTAVESRVERAEVLFDPATAPPEYLDWLAAWLGATLESGWEEARRRLFLQHAWLLFRWRGTRGALVAMIRLALDDCPDASIFAPLRDGTAEPAAAYAGSAVRIVENYELRRTSALLLGDTAASGPALVPATAAWTARLGGERLHALYAAWLQKRYAASVTSGPDAALAAWNATWQADPPLASFSAARFSPVPPAAEAKASDWRAFANAVFEFVYPEVGTNDSALWREFLARRYRTVAMLNDAWNRTGNARWPSFAAVPLPAEDALPADGTPLADWIEFVSLAVPLHRHAHRFTVLVPARLGETQAAREQRLERVARIVEWEKPAHTAFDARLFWALFQVGTARVGSDTVLGEGSRFVAMVLGSGHLGETFLAAGHPWSVTGRPVTGRDRLQG